MDPAAVGCTALPSASPWFAFPVVPEDVYLPPEHAWGTHHRHIGIDQPPPEPEPEPPRPAFALNEAAYPDMPTYMGAIPVPVPMPSHLPPSLSPRFAPPQPSFAPSPSPLVPAEAAAVAMAPCDPMQPAGGMANGGPRQPNSRARPIRARTSRNVPSSSSSSSSSGRKRSPSQADLSDGPAPPHLQAVAGGPGGTSMSGAESAVLLAKLRSQSYFRVLCDQAVAQAVVTTVCDGIRTGELDRSGMHPILTSFAAASVRRPRATTSSLLRQICVLLQLDWCQVLQPGEVMGLHDAADEAVVAHHLNTVQAALHASSYRPPAGAGGKGSGVAMSWAMTYKGLTRMCCNSKYVTWFVGDEAEDGQVDMTDDHPLFFWARAFSPESMPAFAERWIQAASSKSTQSPTPASASASANANSTSAIADASAADGADLSSFSTVLKCVASDGSEHLCRVHCVALPMWGGMASGVSITPCDVSTITAAAVVGKRARSPATVPREPVSMPMSMPMPGSYVPIKADCDEAVGTAFSPSPTEGRDLTDGQHLNDVAMDSGGSGEGQGSVGHL